MKRHINKGKKRYTNIDGSYQFYSNKERLVAPIIFILTIIIGYIVMMANDKGVKANAGQAETHDTPLISPQAHVFFTGETISQTDYDCFKFGCDEEVETTSQKQEIIDYIVEVFGEEAPNAFNVLYCENKGLRPDAINYNSNGSTDHSIFQINSIHAKRFGEGFKTDWRENIRVAHAIQQEQGWTPWACSGRVDIKSFWE